MAFSQWRQWLTRLKQAIYGKPRKKAKLRLWLRPEIESLEDRVVPTGTWATLAHSPPAFDGVNTSILLSDGSVLVHGGSGNASSNYYKLTPDSTGSYQNGTFTTLASSNVARLYAPTAVLPDGRVFMYGGEYTLVGGLTTETLINSGEIYDPVANSWTNTASVPAALDGSNEFGDDPLTVLNNGTVMAGYIFSASTFVYNPGTNTWSAGATKLNGDRSDEESWVKLPDGSILSYDIFSSITSGVGHGQRYVPSTNTWVATGNLPAQLSSAADGSELGPGLLLPDGRALFLGTEGNTAYYTPATNTWAAGPSIPGGLGSADAPAAVLPNGDVLLAAAPTLSSNGGSFVGPTTVFELNPVTNVYTDVTASLSATGFNVSNHSFVSTMLVLPSGQVLLTNDSSQIAIYTESGSPVAAAVPTISGITNNGVNFTLSGTGLTGINEGAGYGDDLEMASNYPIVRLTDGSGNVTFARTSNWSTTQVATGATPLTTTFAATTPNAYLLAAVANGVPSSNVLFVEMGGLNITLRLDAAGTDIDVYNTTTSALLGQFSLASFTAIYANGNGNLTVDYSNGMFGMPVTYEGGVAASSAITVADTAAPATLVYNATGASAGNFIVNGSALNEILFTNTGSAFDTANAATLTINADPGNLIAGTVTNTFTAAGASSLATLSNSLPSLNFVAPTNTLVVNGHGGADNITFTSMGTGFNAALTVQGNGGADVVALDAALTLGSATASGNVVVSAATIDLGGATDAAAGPTPGSITLTGNVVVTAGSALQYGGLGGLNITGGAISLGANNLTLTDTAASDTGIISEQISGPGGSLTKGGPGTLTLSTGVSDTYTGATTVNAGTLEVDAQITSAVSVNGGTLDGTGQVGAANVAAGATLRPGDNNTPGQLTINGNLVMIAGATFAVQIDGTTAGSGFGQLVVAGPIVGLDAATLALSVIAGFAMPLNSAYAIINNTGVSAVASTFNGLPEASTFSASGRLFGITYVGSTGVTSGNDVVVNEKPMTLVWDGNATPNPNWTVAANWVGNVAPAGGDTLSFGAVGAFQITTDNNDFAAGTSFNSIVFTSPGYLLGGNAVTLTNGITSQPAGTNTINLALTLAGSQSYQATGATSNLVLGGALHLAGNTLTSTGAGAIHANGIIDGTVASAIIQQATGAGTLFIAGADPAYLGPTTTVSSGILEVDGSIPSNVAVATTGTLTGTGATGAVTSSGAQFLGSTISTLTTKDLTLNASSTFNFRVNSDGVYSQNNVASGAVSIAAGATLNLSSLAGYSPVAGGESYTIINNSGGSATAVTGTFIAGAGTDTPGATLVEGAILANNYLNSGHIATITYTAGANHHSVAIKVSAVIPLTYTSNTNPNNFLLKKTAAGILQIFDNGILENSQAASQTTNVQIGVAAGLDATLTIDYTNPFTVPVIFDGGTGNVVAHTLTLQNGAYTTTTFNDTTASSGNITLDIEKITYSDLTSPSTAPAIIDTTTQANLIFNLPAAAQGNLKDDTGALLAGVSQINATNSSFANATFENPATALTVNGNGGNTAIQLGAMDPAFSPATETFTGLAVASDTFQFASAAAVPSTTTVTLTAAKLDLHGLSPTIDALNGNGTITNSVAAASVLSVGFSNLTSPLTGTFTGIIQDGGATKTVGLTKSGSTGTETLSGANTYSGATTISAGTLQAGAASALSANSDVTDSAALDLNAFSQSIGALSGAGTVTSSATGAPTLTVGADNNAAPATFSGIIHNGSATSVALAKSGTGKEILNSTTNTYTGGTTVNAGILQIGDGATFGSVGTAGVNIVGGTLQFDSAATSSAAATQFANDISGAGAISLIAGALLVQGNNTSFTGALNISGGSYQLGASNALGGTTSISVSTGGQFYFGTITALTVNATVAISTTGYLDNAGALGPLGAIRFSGASDILANTVTVTGTALVSAYNASSGAISGNITGAGTLQFGSGLGAETIILTGSDGATTTVNGSTTLQVGNGGTVGALTAATVTDNGSLVFERTDFPLATVTVAANIGGNGNGTLTQAGADTLKLTGASNYGGATTVSGGVLEVDGSITSNVNVALAGTLTGTGKVGAVTSAGGHFLGTAISTLTSNALTLNANSKFNVGISGVNTSSKDTVALGAVTLNGVALTLSNIGGYIPTASDVYTIIANNVASNAINGTFLVGAGIDNFAAGATLLEGADLSDNFMGSGRTAILTYKAGPNGDSVAIKVSTGGELQYDTAGAGPRNFTLKEVGANFELFDANSPTPLVPVKTQLIAQTTTIIINVALSVSAGQTTNVTNNNDAALTVDYSGGVFNNKVTFDGGTGTGVALAHTLTLKSATFGTETFTYTGAHTGNVQLDTGPVIYSDLSTVNNGPTIVSTVALTNGVSFILPASAQATFADDATAGNGLSQLTTQNASFAATTFADPSIALTVQTAGSSVVKLGGVDSTFGATSETFTGLASDTFQLTSTAILAGVPSLTLTAATLDLNGKSPSIDALNGTGTITNSNATASTLTIGASGGTGAFTGVIRNAISLTKNGVGTETLGGVNTYTGATTISAGKIVDAVANALPTGTALSGAATLDLIGNSQQVASVTGAGTVTDSGAAASFTVNNAATDSFTGLLSGANLALVKTGSGMLTLGHANTYGGSTTISAGTLKQGIAGAVPGNTLIVNGTLDLGGFGLTVPSVIGSGTVSNSSTTAATFTVNNGSADSFGGAITGSATDVVNLSKTGGGTLTLSSASSYAGTTSISAGTIADGSANALPSGTSLVLTGTGTLDLAGFNQQVGSVTGAGTTTVTDSSATVATFTVNNSLADSFSGTLSNTLGLTKSGNGILTLNGADSYTGPTTISQGTLQAGSAGAFSSSSDVTDNATLDLNGHSETIGALNGSSTVTSTVAGAITLTVGNTGHGGAFAGVIQNGAGTLSLTKTGAGAETLSGTNTYTGTTTLSGGTLTVSGSLYNTTPGAVNLAAAGVTLNGSGTIHGGVNIQASSQVLNTHIDSVTITVPTTINSVGITVASAAKFAQIGVTTGVTVNGGNGTSTGVLVNGSAMIFNSNISGHFIDVNVDGGSAVLQNDTLNAGTGAATGLQAKHSAIVDAGQIATNATPLTAPQYALLSAGPFPVNNVGLYGDITGLLSGTPLGSTAHSTGGNTFGSVANGYTAAGARAIRDLNTLAASFGAIATRSVENSFTYGASFHYGRMDLTAQNNTFDGVANPTYAAIRPLVLDGQTNAGNGFVVYGVPTMTLTQTNVPAYVAPSASYGITINYTNTSPLATFGVISEIVGANETVNLAANPGWVSMGGGLYTYNLGLITSGGSGHIQFNVTVVAKPTAATLTTEAFITADLTSGIMLAPANYVSTTTTVGPNNIRWKTP